MTEQWIEELIRKYADQTATEEEIRLLMDWYEQSAPAGVTWPATSASEKQAIQQRMLQRLEKSRNRKPYKIFSLSALKIAAILLVIIGTALLVYLLPLGRSKFITIANGPGKLQMVVLPDSTRVWLNAASTIRYRASFQKHRDLELTGEAYFEVKHDALHPFTVNAGGVQTKVLGTSFDIMANPDNTSTTVTVLSGRVSVASNAQELAVLTPTLQLVFDRNKKSAQTAFIDTTTVLAWKKGQLNFKGETLDHIAHTLERWYGIRFVFENDGLRTCRYYMNFDNSTPLEKTLLLMSNITGLHFLSDPQNKLVYISGKQCL